MHGALPGAASRAHSLPEGAGGQIHTVRPLIKAPVKFEAFEAIRSCASTHRRWHFFASRRRRRNASNWRRPKAQRLREESVGFCLLELHVFLLFCFRSWCCGSSKFGVWQQFQPQLGCVTLPNALQGLTLGGHFNQSLDCVTLPTGLQSLMRGSHFQSLDDVTFPTFFKA